MAGIGTLPSGGTLQGGGLRGLLVRLLQGMRRNAHVLIYLYLIASMAVIGFVLERYTVARFQAETTREVTEQANTLRARLEGEVLARALQMRGMAAAITASPSLSQPQFEEIARQVTGGDPIIRMIAAAPDLQIRHVYPLASNRGLIGLNYRDFDGLMTRIDQARDDGNTVLDGPVSLQDGSLGLVLRTPIFTSATAEHRGTYWGLMSVALDHELFLTNAGLAQIGTHLDLALRQPAATGTETRMIFGSAALFDAPAVRLAVALPGGEWQLAAMPRGGWPDYAAERQQIRFWVLLATVLALLVAGYFIEISRRKTSAEQNLVSAINAISDGFALFDAQDRLVMCNAPYRRFFGPAGPALKPGMRFQQMLRAGIKAGQYPQAEGREEAWLAERMQSHHAGNFEQEELLPDGTWLRVSERRTADGWTVGFRIDITELKEAQIAAEAANHAKTEFLNVITHELRTPLTVVLGYNAFLTTPDTLPSSQALTAALQRPDATAEDIAGCHQDLLQDIARYSAKMDASGQHLLNLIQETLDYAKIEEGKMTVTPQPLPVRQLIEDVIDQFQQQADAKGLDLWAEADEVQVMADETRLKQVLFNLVGNALKFTDAGEVSIRTELRDRKLHFRVSDSGSGIPQAEQSRVFDSFHQVESSNLRRCGGTGLGLAISRKLVELHGGRISLQSTEGKGSVFEFTIPLA